MLPTSRSPQTASASNDSKLNVVSEGWAADHISGGIAAVANGELRKTIDGIVDHMCYVMLRISRHHFSLDGSGAIALFSYV